MLLYLIGMMYSGKTTIGKALSERLGYQFIDTDEAIAIRYGESTERIIRDKGIDYFRTIESDILNNLVLDLNTVVATGGGIILKEDNVLFMKSNGVVIYLDVPLSELKNRLITYGTERRPLLKDEATLEKIYQERKAIYEKSCEIMISCTNMPINEIVEMIIRKLT